MKFTLRDDEPALTCLNSADNLSFSLGFSGWLSSDISRLSFNDPIVTLFY